MQGRVLIGDQAGEEPSYLFFHRDRMDEAFELQRGVRDRRWKYIRNYQLDTPYSQHIDYMDQMPAMQDWRRLAAADRLAGGQKNWFVTPKPIEELYDTAKDPWELNNLADLPQYAERLARMREATESWQQIARRYRHDPRSGADGRDETGGRNTGDSVANNRSCWWHDFPCLRDRGGLDRLPDPAGGDLERLDALHQVVRTARVGRTHPGHCVPTGLSR